MLYFTPDLLPEFKRYQFQYEKEDDIYEIIIGRFLEEIERIVKRGISRGYEELEENLPTVKQKIRILQHIRKNTILRDKIFCRFSEFTSDVPENRIIKFALYQISQLPLRNSDLPRRARHIFRHLEQVELTVISPATFPQIQFSRLNEHYRTVVGLAKLIIEHCTLNLQTDGKIRYSSYLVDMNVLFQKFLFAYLRDHLKEYSVKEETKLLWDTEGRYALYPDIVIRRSGSAVLVIDAKWKRRQSEDDRPRTVSADLRQVYDYCDTLKIPIGVLVYPRHEASPDLERPVRRENITLLTKTVDLRKEKEEFDFECDNFVHEISRILEDLNSFPTLAIGSNFSPRS